MATYQEENIEEKLCNIKDINEIGMPEKLKILKIVGIVKTG